jgi:heat shock protein HslJ
MARAVSGVGSFALLVTTFAVGLGVGGPAAAQSAQGPAESSWVLERGRGIPASQVKGPSLKLQPQQLSGSTGCNAFTATLVAHPNKRVAIENVALTRKLCGPEENDTEHAFVRALGNTHYLQQGSDTLTFLSSTHKPLLVWKKVAQSGGDARILPTERSNQHAAPDRRSTKPVARHASHKRRHAAHHRAHRHHKRFVAARASFCVFTWFR